jgi:FAD-dependent sensor of blue light
MLVRLVYASRAADPIDDALIKAICETASSRNSGQGITGVLVTQQGQELFLQVLEGSRADVNSLYGSIVRDLRHRDVTLLLYEDIEQRRFSNWRMGMVDLKRLHLGTILRYSDRPVLDPFAMTGKAAMALVEELVASGAITSRDQW